MLSSVLGKSNNMLKSKPWLSISTVTYFRGESTVSLKYDFFQPSVVSVLLFVAVRAVTVCVVI